jgi:hypothetical protein
VTKRKRANATPVVETQRIPRHYTIGRRGRFWAVFDVMGELVCMTVYKRGADEVVRRLCGVPPVRWTGEDWAAHATASWRS